MNIYIYIHIYYNIILITQTQNQCLKYFEILKYFKNFIENFGNFGFQNVLAKF